MRIDEIKTIGVLGEDGYGTEDQPVGILAGAARGGNLTQGV